MTGPPIGHFVNKDEFNPDSVGHLSPAQERYFMASQWRLMWWKLRRHRLAVISGVFFLFIYLTIVISEILAPYNLHARDTRYLYAPPQSVHLFDNGEFVGPFVYGRTVSSIVSIVLSLPTTGPMLLNALQSQDMYLAGSFLMFLATLTVIGTLISDLALAVLDPRIRMGGGAAK